MSAASIPGHEKNLPERKMRLNENDTSELDEAEHL